MTGQELIDYLVAEMRLDDVMATFKKLGFDVDFVAKNVLSAGGDVTVSHIAMLWQGMPNKHDRKRTRELLDKLTEVGLMTSKGDGETWTPKV